jgi:hypothetical protein
MAADEFPYHGDDEVVGPRLGVHALSGFAERGPGAVDEDDLLQLTRCHSGLLEMPEYLLGYEVARRLVLVTDG